MLDVTCDVRGQWYGMCFKLFTVTSIYSIRKRIRNNQKKIQGKREKKKQRIGIQKKKLIDT